MPSLFPAGVIAATVTLSAPRGPDGRLGKFVGMALTCDRKIIHAASGQPLYPDPVNVTPRGGEPVVVQVPLVDQTGYVDETGAAITGWSYVLSGRVAFSSSDTRRLVDRRFQVSGSQRDINLDLIPSGVSIPAIQLPPATVLSVAGHTGAVSIEQLVDDLSENLTPGDIGAATPAQITAAITQLVNLAPSALDTLGEIATQLATDESAAAAILGALNTHKSDHGNPHAVTKAQVGLGLVANLAPADLPVSTAQAQAISTAISNLVGSAPGTLDTLAEIAAQLAVDESAAAAILAALTAHTSDHSNPHQTTKAQVGLGNVDNTADTGKPVSTAQAVADAAARDAAIAAAATDASSKVAGEQTRAQAAEAALVSKAGATMTGPLILSGDPANVFGAATRQYVLARVADLTSGSPTELDTFLEAFQRFTTDEGALSALTAVVAGKQPVDDDLSAIAGLATTPAGRALLTIADAAAGRAALQLGTAATQPSSAFDPAGAAAAAQAGVQAAVMASVDVRAGQKVADQHATGTDDASGYLNGLIASSNGAVIKLLPGATYRLDAPLVAVTGLIIDAQLAKIRRNYNDSGGLLTAMLTSGSSTTKVNDVTVIGGDWGTLSTTSCKGSPFGWYGDNWRFINVRISSWSGGLAWAWVGNRQRLSTCVATGSPGLPGDGGIRILGGDDSVIMGCHVESGDDTYQVVPTGNASIPAFFNVDCNNNVFIADTGSSQSARVMSVGLQNRSTGGVENEMTTSIRDTRFIGVGGQGGSSQGIHVENHNSTGDIDGVDFIGCAQESSSVQGALADFDISRGDTSLPTKGGIVGALKNVTIIGLRSRTPRRMVLKVAGGASDVYVENWVMSSPQYGLVARAAATSGSNTVVVTNPGDGTDPPFGPGDVGSSISAGGVIPSQTVIGTVSADGYTITMTAVDLTTPKNATATNANFAITVGSKLTLDISGAIRFKATRCRFGNSGGGHTIQAGSNDFALPNETLPGTTVDAEFDSCVFYNIPNDMFAINFQRATGALIRNCKFRGVAGETSAGGVRVGAQSSTITVQDGNDFTGLSNPAVKGVVDVGTGTLVVAPNKGLPDPRAPLNTVYRHGPPTDPTAYPVGTFLVDVDDNNHLYEIGA